MIEVMQSGSGGREAQHLYMIQDHVYHHDTTTTRQDVCTCGAQSSDHQFIDYSLRLTSDEVKIIILDLTIRYANAKRDSEEESETKSHWAHAKSRMNAYDKALNLLDSIHPIFAILRREREGQCER